MTAATVAVAVATAPTAAAVLTTFVLAVVHCRYDDFHAFRRHRDCHRHNHNEFLVYDPALH
jgi:hypothetical protein